ncbi:MAG: lysylphosphatidylglycerol synthase transmembrane domain-containing protein [Chthoniobacterales bacterium]
MFSLALLGLVARKINWAELGVVLERLQPGWAFAGWATTFLIIAGLILRWRILLAQQGLPVPNATVFALTWGGQFFNSILPGSTGGDVMKIYQLCRLLPDRKAAAVATVVVDRLAALVALLTLALVGFILEPVPLRLLAESGPRWTGARVALLLGGLILASLVMGGVAYRLLRGLSWLERLGRMLLAARTHFVLGPNLVAVCALAFAVHFINFFVVYLFARALGISISYPQILLMMPVVLFLMLLPITINGHGLRELLLIGYFKQMGIVLTGAVTSGVSEIAVALSLLLVSNDLLWSLPGGIWYFLHFRTRGKKRSESNLP